MILLMISMIKANLYVYSVTILIILLNLLSASSESIQEISQQTIDTRSWTHPNVFILSRGYTTNLTINEQKNDVYCFEDDVKLSIYYASPTWLLFNRFRIWNSTGVINHFQTDHCTVYAHHFTGLILQRPTLIGTHTTVFGYCTNFTVKTSYG